MSETNLTEKELCTLSKDTLISLIIGLQSSVYELNKTVSVLSEQIKVMNQRSYGRSTESSSLIYMPQLELGINEPEASMDNNEPEPSLEKAASLKRQVGKRAEDIKKITNHREEIIELSDEELKQRFGERKWKKLPYQIITKLEHHPASFEAVTYKIGVYADSDDEIIVRADKPVELWANSIATPSLVSSIIFGKYVNAVPLYRQEKTYSENNVFISRATMANWMIAASDRYLKYYYEALKQRMMQESLLHADETPFEVTKDGRTAGSKSYMWVYRTADSSEVKMILYDYRHTRSYEHPKQFLNCFHGTLISDGYQAYHKLEKENPESFTVAGCWVHLKRKFSTLIKAEGTSKTKGTLADTAVKKISKIFHENNKLKELPESERLKKRQEVIQPLVDDFFEWVRKNEQYITPSSETGKGFTYALNQEKYLRVFLSNPRIPMDNNAAEQAIRPFTVGRKNWVMIDTPRGAEASAVLYSLVETAKANNLRIYDYITYLLQELPKYIHDLSTEVPDNLLPWSNSFPKKLFKQ